MNDLFLIPPFRSTIVSPIVDFTASVDITALCPLLMVSAYTIKPHRETYIYDAHVRKTRRRWRKADGTGIVMATNTPRPFDCLALEDHRKCLHLSSSCLIQNPLSPIYHPPRTSNHCIASRALPPPKNCKPF